jgi:hypothetical protein
MTMALSLSPLVAGDDDDKDDDDDDDSKELRRRRRLKSQKYKVKEGFKTTSHYSVGLVWFLVSSRGRQ